MNSPLLATLVMVISLGGCTRTPPVTATMPSTSTASAHSPLIGSWRLAWLELPNADGTLRRITDAHGSLIYTASGQVSVQVMYASADATPSSGPVQYALGGFEGSFGQYVVDDAARTVVHRYDGANVRALVGQNIPRRYEIVGRRLILRSTRSDERWSVAWERY